MRATGLRVAPDLHDSVPIGISSVRTGPATRFAVLAGKVALIAADLAVLAGCLFAAHWLRWKFLMGYQFFSMRGEEVGPEPYLFFVTINLLAFALLGLYGRRVSAIEDSARVLRACFYSTACALVLASLAHVAQYYSRLVIALSAAMAACLLPVSRHLVRSALGRWRAWQRPVVLVGVNRNGIQAARDMEADRTMGYRVAGVFADAPVDGDLEWPVWRTASRRDAIAICRDLGVRSVVLCEQDGAGAALEQSFELLEKFADDIKIAAAGRGLHSPRLESEVLRGSYLLTYANPLTHRANRVVKRAIDIAGSAAALTVTAPLLAVLALLVKLTSPGPVLFRSERVGRAGRHFRCWKFRTMYRDAAGRLERILSEDPAAAREYTESAKLRDDPRITPAGRWLRRRSLDELPQLWNVLWGEMSLVGPRPILPGESSRLDPEVANYFRVRSGLTGLWQISGRSDVSYAERMRLDQFYIRNWSVWLDLVILARTAIEVVRPRGAY